MDFPGGSVVKNLPAMQELQKRQVWSLDGEDLLERKRQSSPVFLPEKSLRERSLVGYSPWCHKESDATECAHTHTHTHTLEKIVMGPSWCPLLNFCNSKLEWLHFQLLQFHTLAQDPRLWGPASRKLPDDLAVMKMRWLFFLMRFHRAAFRSLFLRL